jgi:uncharacterized Zn finger protein
MSFIPAEPGDRSIRMKVYRPCPECGASGNQNFELRMIAKPALLKLKLVCKKCGHARDAT